MKHLMWIALLWGCGADNAVLDGNVTLPALPAGTSELFTVVQVMRTTDFAVGWEGATLPETQELGSTPTMYLFSVVSGLQPASHYFHPEAKAEDAQIDGAVAIEPVYAVFHLSNQSCLFLHFGDGVFFGRHINLDITAGQSPHANLGLAAPLDQKNLASFVLHKDSYRWNGVFVEDKAASRADGSRFVFAVLSQFQLTATILTVFGIPV